MKSLFKIIIVLVIGLTFSFSSNAQDAQIKDYKVEVGFHCANGKRLLETKLAEIKGIESFVVDLETKLIDFKYNPKIITEEQIILAIENIGYLTEFSDKDKKINKACKHGEGKHEHHDHDHEH